MARERFVTLREYLAQTTLQSGLTGMGCAVGIAGVLSSIAVGFALIVILVEYISDPHSWAFREALSSPWNLAVIAAIVGCAFLVSWALLRSGRAMLDAADNVPNVTLITRANIAELPPDQSLVRGSLRPEDEAAESLLRGAGVPKHGQVEGLLLPVQTAEDRAEVQRLIDS